MTFKFSGELSEFDPTQDPDEKSANQSLRYVVYGEPKTKGLDESGAIPKASSNSGSVKDTMHLYRSAPRDFAAQDKEKDSTLGRS